MKIPSEKSSSLQLVEYIQFLNKDKLQEAATENLQLARENDIPLLRLLTHLSDQELFTMVQSSLQTFLKSIQEGKAIEGVKESMLRLKKNELEGISKTKVQVQDVVLAYSIRKQILIKYLAEFTQDPQKIISIALSIEKLYAKIEELAFNAYVDIQEEELKKLNFHLTESQEELQAANEELRESQEELQAINDELKEQVQIRQEAEEILEKERSFLEAIFDNISDGLVACNEKGILLFFNKATRNFHGLREKALSPDEWGPFYNLYQADGKTLLKKEEIPLFRAYKGEIVEGVEMVIAPVKGKKRILIANGRQIISPEGKMLGAVVSMHDVTEIREAQAAQKIIYLELHESHRELATALEELQSSEEQLVEANNELESRVQARTEELAASEEELRQMLDKTIELNEEILENRNLLHTVANASPVTLWLSGTDGGITYVNQTWIDWTGRKFEEHLGEGWSLSIIPEDRKEATEKYAHDFQSRRFFRAEFRIHSPDGQVRWCIAEGVPRTLANGEFGGYAGSCTDITARKLAEEALKVNEERSRFVLESMPQKVWTADAQGNVNYFNQHWMEFTGRPFESLREWGWSDTIHPDDLEENLRLWKISISKASTFQFEHRFRSKSGEYRWHLSRGIPMRDEEGRVVMWVGTNTDVDEQKRQEEKLETQNKQLRELNEYLDNFVHATAHDLRAPVVNMKGLLLLLKGATTKEKEQMAIKMLSSSADRLDNTLQSMIRLIELQSNMELPQEPVKLKEIWQEVLKEHQEELNSIKVSVSTDFSVCPELYLIKPYIISALRNLLSNAIKYRKEGQKLMLEISCKKENEFILFKFKDNGIGIDLEKNRKNLFRPFNRFSKQAEGKGIGLHMIHNMMQRMGGKIEVESQEGMGTTFTLFLRHNQK